MSVKVEQWTKFVHQSLRRRIRGEQFKCLAVLMIKKYPLSGEKALKILLESRNDLGIPSDPLVPRYIDALFSFGRFDLSDVLSALLQHSTVSVERMTHNGTPKKNAKSQNSFLSDYRILQDITMATTSDRALKSLSETNRIVESISKWIDAIISWKSKVDEGQDSWTMSFPEAAAVFEAVGVLFSTLFNNERFLHCVYDTSNTDFRTKIGKALSAYIPFLLQIPMTIGDTLESIQKQFNLYDNATSKALGDTIIDGVNVNALQFEAGILDGPVINTRAGLHVYLNALLVGRPLVDDSTLINYFNSRYADDHILLAVELITAAFDVLSNGMYMKESSQTMFVFRSFLVNKVPPVLSYISAASIEPIPAEFCIQQALSKVDPNAFPSFSQTFGPIRGNSALFDVRQDFLFACALHRLIPETSIEQLLGEDPMQTLPAGGQYIKEDLVMQINSNSERADQLIGEIESMEGNAGAIVGAIVEVMQSLCLKKETMTLKHVCSSLTRRSKIFDIMLLFRSPATILQPLCALLDAWKWDEDQGECQPVYDEFGSILLLVLAFKYRYDLTPYDLGISNDDSFVLRLLERGATSKRLEDLTEAEHQHLGAWITALFVAEGISDELMSSCSPQEFYLLVATLFSQSLVACEAGKLDFDTLRGGLEYLLEPFLLPSLVIALNWLSTRIWTSTNSLFTSLQTLLALLKPTSTSSSEAREIHSTILSINGWALEHELKEARRTDPSRAADIKPILDLLTSEPHTLFKRNASTHHTELETWTTTSSGGLLASIRHTFSSLVLWSTNPDISMTPPNYTHRQLLVGLQVHGAVRVLRAIVDEVKLQAETGSGDLAIDIAATLVVAPTAQTFAVDQTPASKPDDDGNTVAPPPQRVSANGLTLHDALHLLHNDVPALSTIDAVRAEYIVRLHRRVESLLQSPLQFGPAAPHPHQQEMNDADMALMGDMNLEAVAANAAVDVEAAGAPVEDIEELINAAAAATAGMGGAGGDGVGIRIGPGGGDGLGRETSIDDVLLSAEGTGMEGLEGDWDMDGVF